MQFTPSLVPATLIKRYKRFLADVTLADGSEVTVHCPNTGAMTGCAEPGMQVWLSKSANPKRKYAYTWELSVSAQQHWICVNTQRANHMAAEALNARQISELADYTRVTAEVPYGSEKSRVDFLLQGDGLVDCYVEVKSVTLLQDGLGAFPDAVSKRGQKHLRELTELVRQGKRAVMLYMVMHTGIEKLNLHSQIDPDYSAFLQQARQAGVRVICYSCNISQEKMLLNQSLTFSI